MATERQIAANRQNAAGSTGPRTAEGKQASRLNAIKHGLLADAVFVPILDRREEWEQFRAELLESLQPAGGLELLLAERVIAAAWRLARVARYERDVIYEAVEPEADRDERLGGLTGRRSGRGGKSRAAGSIGASAGQFPSDAQLPDFDTCASITRYEAHLHRQFMQCLHELQRVQARRLGTPEAAPAAVDVVLSDPALPEAHAT